MLTKELMGFYENYMWIMAEPIYNESKLDITSHM